MYPELLLTPTKTKVVAEKSKVQTPAQREIVIGAGAKALQVAGQTLTLLLADLNETVNELGLKIDERAAGLAGLEDLFRERERQSQINMNLNLQEKGLAAANELLGKQNKVSIDQNELNALREENKRLQANYKDDLTKATTAITNELSTKWENERKLLIATHEKDEADNKAKITAQGTQINMLENQVKMLAEQLNAEREAGVKRAQAGAIGAINVGGEQNRR